MKRLLVAVVSMVLLVLGASSAPAAAQPPGDSVTGSGTTGNFFGRFQIDVRSGPSGENPTGQASFESGVIGPIDGPATCLAVSGKVAVFNLQTPQFGVVTFEITDNAGSGQPDTIEGRATGQNEGRSPTDCSPLSNGLSEIVVEGDVVVVDAPPLPTSKEQCKNGGWRTFGVFKNQGDCVSFAATGGKNPPGKERP
ncbi:MAG TPA: hypothetical protein VNS49_17950 [Streptomyces sp.]|nr:hypothetical protein [Streptomyces sp.]